MWYNKRQTSFESQSATRQYDVVTHSPLEKGQSSLAESVRASAKQTDKVASSGTRAATSPGAIRCVATTPRPPDTPCLTANLSASMGRRCEDEEAQAGVVELGPKSAGCVGKRLGASCCLSGSAGGGFGCCEDCRIEDSNLEGNLVV